MRDRHAAIEQLAYGRDGLLEAIRDDLVIADCSSGTCVHHSNCSRRRSKGGQFVDTPMTRTPRRRKPARLQLWWAARRRLRAHSTRHESFANTIVYAGPVGAAHRPQAHQ